MKDCFAMTTVIKNKSETQKNMRHKIFGSQLILIGVTPSINFVLTIPSCGVNQVFWFCKSYNVKPGFNNYLYNWVLLLCCFLRKFQFHYLAP